MCIDGRSQHLQLVLPSGLRESVLQNLHSSSMGGHEGESKMIHLVRERYYWPGWKEIVKVHVVLEMQNMQHKENGTTY